MIRVAAAEDVMIRVRLSMPRRVAAAEEVTTTDPSKAARTLADGVNDGLVWRVAAQAIEIRVSNRPDWVKLFKPEWHRATLPQVNFADPNSAVWTLPF